MPEKESLFQKEKSMFAKEKSVFSKEKSQRPKEKEHKSDEPPHHDGKTAPTVEQTAEAAKFHDEPMSKAEKEDHNAESDRKGKKEEHKDDDDKKDKGRTKKSSERAVERADSPPAPTKPPKLRHDHSKGGSHENAVAKPYDDEEEAKDALELKKMQKKDERRRNSSKREKKNESAVVRKKNTHPSGDETTNKKLEKLKQNMIKQENSKRSTKSKKKKKTASKVERKQPVVAEKKSFRERLKKKFDAVGVFFTSKGYQLSLLKAQKKNSTVSTKKVGEGDDAFPVNLAQRKAMEGDEYEELDGALMSDKTHRADLDLVKNKDNKSNLFIDGKPFWKDKKFNSEIQPDNKLLSKVLVEVVNQKRTLMEQNDEPVDLDEFHDMEVMKGRNDSWFREDHITSNTIRSIVGTMGDGENTAIAAKKSNEPLKPLNVVEPKQMFSYRRHFVSQGNNVTFVKSPANMELRRLKVKKHRSGSSAGSSTSSNSSTSNDDKKKGPKN